MRKVTVHLEGQSAEADQIDFEPEAEPWVALRLEDGTRLRAKLVVHKVYRLVGKFAPDGDPLYQVLSATVLTVDVPPNLRRPGGAA